MNLIESETQTGTVNTALHRVGTTTGNVMTAQEAIETAGLDWKVELEDIYFRSRAKNREFETQVQVEDNFAVVRQDKMKALGVVGKRYTPIQNQEAFQFMDNIVDSGEAKYEIAGELHGGKLIYIMINIDKALPIEKDTILPYMLLTNSHNGSSSLQVMMLPVRLSCSNMIRYNMAGKYERSFRVSHTKSATAKINDARVALGIADRFFDEFAKDVNLLIEQEIDNAKFWAMVKSIVPEPQELEKGASEDMKKTYERQMKNRDRALSRIGEYWSKESGYFGANKWTALNAVNSYELWSKPTGKDERARYERQATSVLKQDSLLTTKARHELERI